MERDKGINRRRLLTSTALLGVGGLVAACSNPLSSSAPTAAADSTAADSAGTVGSQPSADSKAVIDRITSSGKLRVGWATWNPYYIKSPSGEVSGIAARIAEAMARELDVELIWVEDSWGTVIAGLNSDKFDLSLALDPTLPRALAAGFSKSYGTISTNLMIRKQDEAKYQAWQDADKEGVKIGVTLGASTDLHVTNAFKRAEIVRVKTLPDAILALAAGQVDGVGSSIGPARDAIEEHPDLTVLPGALGISGQTIMVRREDQVTLNWLNLFIDAMEISGFLDSAYAEFGIERNQVY